MARISLTEQLGRGPAGFTYKGRYGDRELAVKILSSGFEQYPDALQKLQSDLDFARRLNDEGAVGILGSTQIRGRRCVLFELVPGRTLAEVLALEGPQDPVRALGWIRQACETLDRLGTYGLHHGDLRPQKLLIDSQGRLRIADFGLAGASCLASGFSADYALPFGHPTYLAPEVLQLAQTTPEEESDVYALGITLYELICGRPPYVAADPYEVLRMHLEEVLPPPPARVEVSPGLARLVVLMTHKDPDRRPSSMKACLSEIRELLPEQGGFDRSKSLGPDAWISVADLSLSRKDWKRESIRKSESRSKSWSERAPSGDYPQLNQPLELGKDWVAGPGGRSTILVALGLVAALLLANLIGFVIMREPAESESQASTGTSSKVPARSPSGLIEPPPLAEPPLAPQEGSPTSPRLPGAEAPSAAGGEGIAETAAPPPPSRGAREGVALGTAPPPETPGASSGRAEPLAPPPNTPGAEDGFAQPPAPIMDSPGADTDEGTALSPETPPTPGANPGAEWGDALPAPLPSPSAE